MTDVTILVAAMLYDTLEDTSTTQIELSQHFGPEVLALVQQLSEDPSLSATERMSLQIERAAILSSEAKQIRLAEKICSLEDLSRGTAVEWPIEQRRGFLNWVLQVGTTCHGVNRALDDYFDQLMDENRETVSLSS